MKRLTLDMDRLAVDTFVAGAASAAGGTVQAHATGHTCGHTLCCPYTYQLQCSVTGNC